MSDLLRITEQQPGVLTIAEEDRTLTVQPGRTKSQLIVQSGAGAPGPQGSPGPDGPQGPQGATQAAQGPPGQPRYTGEGPPPDAIVGSTPGDEYLDVTSGLIYKLT